MIFKKSQLFVKSESKDGLTKHVPLLYNAYDEFAIYDHEVSENAMNVVDCANMLADLSNSGRQILEEHKDLMKNLRTVRSYGGAK